jgi:hypothetical protein
MRKLKSLLCALALTFVFTVPVLAGNVPIGGYCDSQACVEANPPDEGLAWYIVAGTDVFMLWFI